MGMTFLELRTEVRANLRRDVDALADSRVNQFINWSVRRVARRHTFSEMRAYEDFTIVADTYRFAHPTRMKDISTFIVQDGTNSRELDYVWWENLDTYAPRPEETSTQLPYAFVDYGTEFEVFPISDADYTGTYRYSQYPVDLSLDADESALSEKDQIIVTGATAHGMLTLNEYDFSMRWNSTFNSLLNEAIIEDNKNPGWKMVARGFTGGGGGSRGEYWTRPGYGR